VQQEKSENKRNNHYNIIFKEVMDKVMDAYRPNVIVYQSGADSLADDILGI